MVALTGSAGQTNYAASKAGLIGFARSLAREIGSRKVTVNVVAPGFIETDMTAALPEARRDELLGQIPLKRFAGRRRGGRHGDLAGLGRGRLHHRRGHPRRRWPRDGALMADPLPRPRICWPTGRRFSSSTR